MEFQILGNRLIQNQESLEKEIKLKLMEFRELKAKLDEKQPTLDLVEAKNGDLSNIYRITMNEKKP